MLLATLRKAAAEGRDAKETLSLYSHCCRHEREQYAMLQGLPPPPPHARSAAPPPWSVPLSAVSVAAPAPETTLEDDASAADTARASSGYDAAAALQALRGALAEMVQPCCPAGSALAQPTLREVTSGASPCDVLARDRHETLQGFQAAKPPTGRRCYCHRRRGDECHITLDRAFLEELVGQDRALRDAFDDPTALRDAILALLGLGPGAIRTRPGYKAQGVFGFCRRRPAAAAALPRAQNAISQ